MIRLISRAIDRLSEYFAARKGLLPLIGILLVAANFVVRLLPLGWLSSSDLLLHLGIILAIFGFMIAWAL
jgi:TRAP-type mannitol/chloroaromatic compound transport system permease small subunit